MGEAVHGMVGTRIGLRGSGFDQREAAGWTAYVR